MDHADFAPLSILATYIHDETVTPPWMKENHAGQAMARRQRRRPKPRIGGGQSRTRKTIEHDEGTLEIALGDHQRQLSVGRDDLDEIDPIERQRTQ